MALVAHLRKKNINFQVSVIPNGADYLSIDDKKDFYETFPLIKQLYFRRNDGVREPKKRMQRF